jgi:hypothetical protein
MTLGKRPLLVLAIVLAPCAAVALAQSVPTPIGERPDCVRAEAVARMQAYGFDHWVTVTNTCDQPMSCNVSSDVQPTPNRARIASGAHQEFLLWRGSPASTFQARVDCEQAH